MGKPETSEDVARWFEQALAKLWPIADGSLSYRKSPCIRTKCAACESGEGHRRHVLYGKRDGQRFSLYVPEEIAPEVEQALRNGEALQQLMMEAGERYIRALKRERAESAKRRKN